MIQERKVRQRKIESKSWKGVEESFELRQCASIARGHGG
jgi:hypothetical protein